MLKHVELDEYMVRHPVKVHPENNLMEAIHLILVHRISGICVVDQDNKLIGVLSEVDCLRGILSATYNDTAIGTVAEFMTSNDVYVAHLGESIIDIASDMLQKKVRRRPVVASDGTLLGQITIRQILRAVKEFTSPVDRSEQH